MTKSDKAPAAADPAAAGDAAPAQDPFAAAFAGLAAGVARPVFERFARLAMRRGFAAVVTDEVDADGNRALLLRVIPERGGLLGMTPCAEGGGECVFVLKAVVAERMVVHSACHDASRGWGGMSITRSGLHSINHGFLEAGLEQFLRGALEARHLPQAGAG